MIFTSIDEPMSGNDLGNVDDLEKTSQAATTESPTTLPPVSRATLIAKDTEKPVDIEELNDFSRPRR